ncbi:hypothetical protein BgAZ_206070 [Babesia gibsoni]|uniref:Uncharacterized protein n=1 Tax=Babesia gibsoni TaxID=33632 RepID=A0AAD8PEB5_BABGI|nr:hypothetical protein BgAZ_206070 [Babesia gibsoni]
MNTNMNRITSSPLGCCKPKEERQMISPVFRQQYINDHGKMKLTVPVSPIHYIAASGYYANDYRFSQQPHQWEVQPVPYPHAFDQHMINMDEHRHVDASTYAQQVDSASQQRSPTPNIHLMMQQGGQASVQLGRNGSRVAENAASIHDSFSKAREFNVKDVTESLIRIEEHLKKLEDICMSNQTGILRVLRTLLGTERSLNGSTGGNPKLHISVPSVANSISLKDEQSVIDSREVSGLKVEAKQSLHSQKDSESVSNSNLPNDIDMAPLAQVCNLGNCDEGSKVFDVSQELKKSNDMLEKYLSSSDSFSGSEDQGTLLHENMNLSICGQNNQKDMDSGITPALIKKTGFPKDSARLKGFKSLDVKPLVTTASMASTELQNNALIENLEKRFKLMMSSLEGMKSETKEPAQSKSLPQTNNGLMAIGNEGKVNIGSPALGACPIERKDSSIQCGTNTSLVPITNNDAIVPISEKSLALLESGQIQVLNTSGEIVPLGMDDQIVQTKSGNLAIRMSTGELVPCQLSKSGEELVIIGKRTLVTMENDESLDSGNGGSLLPLSNNEALACLNNESLALLEDGRIPIRDTSGEIIPMSKGDQIVKTNSGKLAIRTSVGEIVPCQISQNGGEIVLLAQYAAVSSSSGGNTSQVSRAETGLAPMPTMENQYKTNDAVLQTILTEKKPEAIR